MPEPTEPPAIAIHDLEFAWRRDDPPLLRIGGFTVQPRQKVFVQGPSGAGKSTLLGLIGGVLLPRQGEIQVLGQSVSAMRGPARDRFRVDHIGFIFQLFNLIPYLSVLENVLVPIRYSRERRRRLAAAGQAPRAEALRLLAALGLEDGDLLARRVGELSMGQQQRVAGARALLGQPEILVADEPTSSLDADAKEVFLDTLFGESDAAGTTVLFVSHDTSLAPKFDQMVALGEINRTAPAN